MKTLVEHINEQLLMELRSTKKNLSAEEKEFKPFKDVKRGDTIYFYSTLVSFDKIFEVQVAETLFSIDEIMIRLPEECKSVYKETVITFSVIEKEREKNIHKIIQKDRKIAYSTSASKIIEELNLKNPQIVYL